jgi:hypothetical protein
MSLWLSPARAPNWSFDFPRKIVESIQRSGSVQREIALCGYRIDDPFDDRLVISLCGALKLPWALFGKGAARLRCATHLGDGRGSLGYHYHARLGHRFEDRFWGSLCVQVTGARATHDFAGRVIQFVISRAQRIL